MAARCEQGLERDACEPRTPDRRVAIGNARRECCTVLLIDGAWQPSPTEPWYLALAQTAGSALRLRRGPATLGAWRVRGKCGSPNSCSACSREGGGGRRRLCSRLRACC